MLTQHESLSKAEVEKIKQDKLISAATLQEFSTYVLPFFFSNLEHITSCPFAKGDFVWLGHLADCRSPNFLTAYSSVLASDGTYSTLNEIVI